MKFNSLVSKLVKSGLTVHSNGNTYFAKGATHTVEFHKQNDYAVAVYVIRNTAEDDSMTDYFPGFFPKTIKLVLEYVKPSVESKAA